MCIQTVSKKDSLHFPTMPAIQTSHEKRSWFVGRAQLKFLINTLSFLAFPALEAVRHRGRLLLDHMLVTPYRLVDQRFPELRIHLLRRHRRDRLWRELAVFESLEQSAPLTRPEIGHERHQYVDIGPVKVFIPPSAYDVVRMRLFQAGIEDTRFEVIDVFTRELRGKFLVHDRFRHLPVLKRLSHHGI